LIYGRTSSPLVRPHPFSLPRNVSPAQALVVSLGVDTFAGDPISGFALQSDDYLRMGERLAAVGLPTVLVFEGGYAVDAVGVNAVNVLQAFG
jgi:acetoin utilization deacetylase AcuC-like enzyme